MPIVRYRYHGLPILSHRRSLSLPLYHSPPHPPEPPLYLYAVRTRPTSSDTITDPPFISISISLSHAPVPLLSTSSLSLSGWLPPPSILYRQTNAWAVDTTNNLITSHRQCAVSHRSADFHFKGIPITCSPFELSIHS